MTASPRPARFLVTLLIHFASGYPIALEDRLEEHLEEAGVLAPLSGAVQGNAGPVLEVQLLLVEASGESGKAAGRAVDLVWPLVEEFGGERYSVEAQSVADWERVRRLLWG